MKDTVRRIKRQDTELEKIFAKHIYDKGVVHKIYQKRVLKLHNKKTNNSFRNGQKI